MEMKKIAWILCLTILFVGFSYIHKASAQKPIELSFSVFQPAAHKATLMSAEWAKEIEKRTNGRVKITVFSGGTLSPPDKCYQGVITGVSDIGYSVLGYTKGRFPLAEVFDTPLGIKSGVVSTNLANAYAKKFQPKELDDTKFMYFHGNGPGLLHTKKPVYNLQDLKGMKIRTAGPMSKIIAHLGGAPVGMPMGESYDALSKGVIEGILCPMEALEGFKLAEVVKYTTECYGIGYTGIHFTTMNKDKWNALPPDIQKIINDVNEEWIPKTGKMWDELDRSGKEFALKLGHQMIPLSKAEEEAWIKALEPLFDEYVKNMKAKDLPGEEVLKFCMDFLKKNQ
jgi:TRAP-type C4-dicarboxylate transport system substrate-binding protein